MLVRKTAPVAAMGKRILVVDDDPQILKLLSSYLGGKGYIVETSQNGWDCLKDVLRFDPDLLILDIKMPKMDGMAVLNMLKNGGFKKEVPVILLTAVKQPASVVTAGQLHTDEYVVKPFDLEDLGSRIASHLFSMDFTVVCELLALMETPDKNFLKDARVPNSAWKGWKAFRITHEEIDLCFLIAPKAIPSKLAHMPEAEVKLSTVVLVRQTTTWKQIWP